ncbi:L-threonine ammonia-lyase-like isoform X2 [Nymphalis io]|uniref:L-threonine ammonia-lyase-like isoform X2 n=1 Tax=Inachis io TaxID=171585 RepID=UPI0021680BBA|nr:L-threonine ammonia-lyase-like isoform X2 [Nymphalis io]
MDNPELDKPYVLSFNEIKQAAERIENGIIHTPLCEAKICKYMDYNIYLKCDNLQYTGSCAERGVRNAFVAQNDEMRGRGVIVPSNGNMALAAAYHGGTLGIPVTVVLPEHCPPSQSQRCAELGADVVMVGETFEDTVNYAKKSNREERQIILRSDDPLVMAGLGTLGVEIITQLPETDAVIVPVANGALLAATLVACKKLKCTCLIYLVVDEAYIARAVISLLERERLVADGAGVCALAAVMQGLVPELRGKRAVCVISGGNIDSGKLSRTIQRGLGVSGRMMRFAVALPDHCRGLEVLAKTIADERAVLKSLVTEQMWVHTDVGITWANVVVETANEEHASIFKDHLRDLYPTIRFAMVDIDDKHKAGLR